MTTITWRGLTLHGSPGPGLLTFATLEGWEDLPGPRQASTARAQGHGDFDARVWSSARTVLASGRCSSPEERDALLVQLQASFNFNAPDALPLTIDHAGRVLSSRARLLRFKPTSPAWGTGFFGWAAEWACSDPIRYGATVSSLTAFPVQVAGLRFPLFTNRTIRTGMLDFGARSTSGTVTLTNPGTADVEPVFEVAGPIPTQGFDIVNTETGERIRFAGPVPTGSRLVIDSASGTAVLDGVADRGGALTYREWFPVPAGGSVTIAFLPLGTISAATLTASLAAGWW